MYGLDTIHAINRRNREAEKSLAEARKNGTVEETPQQRNERAFFAAKYGETKH